MNEMMRGDKKINVYHLAEISPVISNILAFLILLIKSYETSKD